jgi:hypothetical protein
VTIVVAKLLYSSSSPGVLTGVGREEDLTHADLIVEDISRVVDLVTPPEDCRGREWHSVQVGQSDNDAVARSGRGELPQCPGW